MADDDLIQAELMLNRFRKLMTELIRGELVRNSFHAWEVDLLVDIAGCSLESKHRHEVLRQYQRAVERQMEIGPGPPMKLSEFLQLKSTRRPTIR
jgi:hypothetical protein